MTDWVAYVTQPMTGDDWQDRAVKMATAVLEEIVQQLRGIPTTVVIETPSNWFTEKGMDSKNDEAVQKLYWFVGHLTAAVSARMYFDNLQAIWTAIPQAWKGQTPKEIMVKRATAQMLKDGLLPYEGPGSDIPHDAAEAVLLARIGAQRIMSNEDKSKGWAKVWSREGMSLSKIKVRIWSRDDIS